jgi:hypothetical protein
MIRYGTAYQILDPWSTSWYSGLWLQSIPRQNALGDTIGEAYEKGMSEVGIEYLVNQWWWDLNENVLFYGDPDLRVFTPSTEYDIQGNNNWDIQDIKTLAYEKETSINSHTPFGSTTHPNIKQPKTLLGKYLWLFGILGLIVILLIAVVLI